MADLPRNQSFLSLPAAIPSMQCPRREDYHRLWPSHPTIVTENHSYGRAYLPDTWVLAYTPPKHIAVGQHFTCKPKESVDAIATFFDITIVEICTLEHFFVEFVAIVYPANNRTYYGYLRVHVSQADLGFFTTIRHCLFQSHLINTIGLRTRALARITEEEETS
ncbi:hypothetical protein A0H81_03692 [Grifola frondosa]|uniref:Uncharacterized protein n=1 Tax=Grifola frondosa TaxID=5627 RepID=A0A1C7MIQ7_GRIFR|nr:hypothetical protein A0H81_03692 [Grifola frondosa]